MPTATRSSTSGAARAAAVLAGYNFPFIAWTGAAIVQALDLGGLPWRCPVEALLGWCPACGLTHSYAALLRGEGLQNLWLGAVLAGFVVNLAWSLVKAGRILRAAGGSAA